MSQFWFPQALWPLPQFLIGINVTLSIFIYIIGHDQLNHINFTNISIVYEGD
jgi:sterol desaturase/sphingolipid hydroxylase (fatty acid hydroxylase superfamily)